MVHSVCSRALHLPPPCPLCDHAINLSMMAKSDSEIIFQSPTVSDLASVNILFDPYAGGGEFCQYDMMQKANS